MNYLILFLLSLSVFAQDQIKIEGTLFKQNNQWMIFVESNEGTIKKGVFQLIDLKKEHQKYLIDKKFAIVVGIKKECDSKYFCIRALSIKTGKYFPIKHNLSN